MATAEREESEEKKESRDDTRDHEQEVFRCVRVRHSSKLQDQFEKAALCGPTPEWDERIKEFGGAYGKVITDNDNGHLCQVFFPELCTTAWIPLLALLWWPEDIELERHLLEE